MRKKKLTNYQKLRQAHQRINYLEAMLLAFTDGQLPRRYSWEQLTFKRYGDHYAELLEREDK